MKKGTLPILLIALCLPGIVQANNKALVNEAHRLLIGNVFGGTWYSDCLIATNGHESVKTQYEINKANEKNIVITTNYYSDDHCHQISNFDIATVNYHLSGLTEDNVGIKYYILSLLGNNTSKALYFSQDTQSNTLKIKTTLEQDSPLLVSQGEE